MAVGSVKSCKWRLSDIDIEGNNIYIHRLKNGFSTVHPLYRRERKSLMLWMNKRKQYRGADTDWLFLSNRGAKLSRQRIYWLIRNYSQAANLTINAHPHMLRHGCGFALADRN
jgi:type 1 fimbriae regulatory protein FimB